MSKRIYKARKYRYADGIAYRPNLYQLHWMHDDGVWTKLILGGMIVLKDKVFAYVGSASAVKDNIERIMKSGHTKHYVWANSMEEALTAIRPYLDAQNA